MSSVDLLKFVRREPFEPYVIELNDGTKYHIRDHYSCMPLIKQAVIGIYASPWAKFIDRKVNVAYSEIARIVPSSEA